MEICKAPTLRFKALNKHTHIMYIEMEIFIKTKQKTIIYRQVFEHNYAKDARTRTTINSKYVLALINKSGAVPKAAKHLNCPK